MLTLITGQSARLSANPALARSIANRFPYIDLINYLQVELMRRHRANKPASTEPYATAGDEKSDADTIARLKRGIQISVNGIASGLRNTG
jgi:phosphoenolpyruvate carboxylase